MKSRLALGILIVLTFCVAGGLRHWIDHWHGEGSLRRGAVGATVVVASPERGINRETTTNSTGDYNQSGLTPGSTTSLSRLQASRSTRPRT